MVAFGQYNGNLDGHGAIMGIMHGGSRTPLSSLRSYGMGVTLNMALDMYGSLHLTIPYQLRGEQEDLEEKFQCWIGDIGC